MSDIFQEVDEEVRREQLKKLWDRYGNFVVAALILVVVGVAAWRGYAWRGSSCPHRSARKRRLRVTVSLNACSTIDRIRP